MSEKFSDLSLPLPSNVRRNRNKNKNGVTQGNNNTVSGIELCLDDFRKQKKYLTGSVMNASLVATLVKNTALKMHHQSWLCTLNVLPKRLEGLKN